MMFRIVAVDIILDDEAKHLSPAVVQHHRHFSFRGKELALGQAEC
jgi:hypothetical protein